MPRTPSLQVGQVVNYAPERTGVIVDYVPGDARPYFVVETDPAGNKPRGPGIKRRAYDLTATGGIRVRPVLIFEQSKSLSKKDCSCLCCYHGQLALRHRDPCACPACDRPAMKGYEWCRRHLSRWESRGGDPCSKVRRHG